MENKKARVAFVLLSFALAAHALLVAPKPVAPRSLEIIQVYSDATSTVETSRNGSGRPTQGQKDAVARVCKSKFTGKELSTCYDDLLALAWTESRFQDPAPIGDHNLAFGNFQIHAKLHGVTVEQAEDFEWAANWTLGSMMKQGYPVYRSWALGTHNSRTPKVNASYSQMIKSKSAEFARAGM